MFRAEELFKNIADKNHPSETVLTIIQGKGTLPREQAGRNIHYDDASLTNYKKVEKGDFIIHLRSFEGGLEMANESGIVSPAYTILRCKKPHSSLFYEAYFHTDEFINHILSKSVEGIRDGRQISYDAFKWLGLPYCLPSEQEKISQLFAVLNKRIEKQQQLVDALKKYKRGLLREIFAKLSESCDKRNLKDVSVLFADGDWIESKDQAADGIRLVQTGNVGFGVYLDKPKNAKYISESTFHRLNCLEIFDGDILISRLPEPAGRACLLPKSTERRITAVDCTVIRTDGTVIDRNYLLQFLCSEQYLKIVNSFLAGGTRQRVSRKNLEGIEIPYPSIDQQQYYGNYLCKVDARISNAEQRLNCLNRLRIFMLQQLFI